MKWEQFFDYNVTGERIIIKDGMIMVSENEKEPEWPCVKVNPGKYKIELSQEDNFVAAVRIYKEGSNLSLGGKIGELQIDHAKAAFCDYDLLLKTVQNDPEGYMEWTENECEEAVWENEKGEVCFKNHKMIFFQSGDGDGVYPVFELLDDTKIVGMLCEFENLNNSFEDKGHPKNRPFWEIERIIYDDANNKLSAKQIASLREYIRTTFKEKHYDRVIELEYLIVKYLESIDQKMLSYSKKQKI